MYLIKLPQETIAALYQLREQKKREGEKATIAGLVRDAVNEKIRKEQGNYCKHWMPPEVCGFCQQEIVANKK